MRGFETILAEAEADPGVLGVVPGGSRGKRALVTERSDHDLYVIVRDEAARDRWATRHPLKHGEPVEVVMMTLEQFREHALHGSPTAWNAYTFAHVTPLVDRGGIATADELPPRLVRILATGDQEEQRDLFRDAEQLARERGLGEVIDGWEPDVPWLRGDPSNEGRPEEKSLQTDPPNGG
jgi:hypothetical protein